VETLFHQLEVAASDESQSRYGEDLVLPVRRRQRSGGDRMEGCPLWRSSPVLCPVMKPSFVPGDEDQVTLGRLKRGLDGPHDWTPDCEPPGGLPGLAKKSMFLFGPSGTGKSALAESVTAIHGGGAVPYAVEVEGQSLSIRHRDNRRGGWPPPDATGGGAWCARPCIMVGGELVRRCWKIQRDAEPARMWPLCT